MKAILTIIQTLITIYWAGTVARQNEDINKILTIIEDGYTRFNSRLKDASIKKGLFKICSFYGWLAVTMFVLLLIVGSYFKHLTFIHRSIVLAFTCTLLAWCSLKWYLDHKAILKSFAPQFGLLVGGPILIGIADIIFKTNLAFILFASLKQLSLPVDITFLSNPILQGAVVSGFFLVFFACSYVITSIMAGPVVFLSVAILALPIMTANISDKIAPQTNFFGFSIIVYVIVSLWLALL